MFVVARSTVILIVCTEKKERGRGKEEEEEENDEQEYTHTHTTAKHIGQLRPMAETHACREHHPVKR